MKYSTSVKITNSAQERKILILEPWGEEYEMLAGKTFEFLAKAEREGSFEVEFGDDQIIVYLWSGSTVNIFCDDEELGAGNFQRPIVPGVPAGQSVSSFLEFMLGRDK